MKIRSRTVAATFAVCALLTASCSGSESTESADASADTAGQETSDGLRTISAEDALLIQENPPEDLVILDVRTLEEFSEGHLEGAVMLDFYNDAFAGQIADLDPDVPYLLYCRSGNRSGQTIALMEQLGFSNVANVDGGILAWDGAGQPIVTE